MQRDLLTDGDLSIQLVRDAQGQVMGFYLTCIGAKQIAFIKEQPND